MLSSRTDGVENPTDSIVGYYYEHPMIGYDATIGSQQGLACTNTKHIAMYILLGAG